MSEQRIVVGAGAAGELVGPDGAPLVVDPFARELTKLSLKDGDVVVVRLKDAKQDVQPTVTYLRAWLRNNGLSRVRLLGVVGEVSVEALSPEQMKEFGWVRA